MQYGGLIVVLAVTLSRSVFAQSSTWCGKNYMHNQTVVPPGGQFQLPATSEEPLIAFRCSPAFRPYLEGDAKNLSFIIDTPVVYRYIQGASPISLSRSGCDSTKSDALGTMEVTISIGSDVFSTKEVPLNTTGYEIPVDISSLTAQKTAYSVACSAVYRLKTSPPLLPQYFFANTSLLYLPDTDASVVKTDLRTGALWARPADGKGGDFQPFIPQGFYVSFDQYLVHNLSLIDQLKADGFNTIHPIPPYDNATVFQQILDKTVELGLYVIYDLRLDYQNLTAVAEQIEAYKSLPNLLLWETAHEPDGYSDSPTSVKSTYDLIYEQDGYHPVSTVLNCEDYNFASYMEGADIIIEDAYPVGINATYSPVWHTPCTLDFGHCGCDNCEGNIRDITTRIQTFKDRLGILGYDRSKTVWTTPQAIGDGAYWNTIPTGLQWAAMGLTSYSHGATGSISFQYLTTTDNATTIGEMAMNLNGIVARAIQPFIVDPHIVHETLDIEGVDVGIWNNGTAYLFVATNLNSSEVHLPWSAVGLEVTDSKAQIQPVFYDSQAADDRELTCGPGGIGIYIVTLPV